MNEKHCYDLLGGQALDALDAEDRALALAHLEHCPQCRDGCAELRNTLHRCFGTALPQRAPSPLVRTQFLEIGRASCRERVCCKV